jgi:hypothetical protein
MLEPKTEQKGPGKNRTAIKQALAPLREEHADGGSAVELQSLIEQACNFYLKQGCFPETYEEMQQLPVLKVGILPYAGDDGGELGQAYRLRVDLEGRDCCFAFRAPDERGAWPATWTEPQLRLPLPAAVVNRLAEGALLAPTLREIAEAGGTRYAVLDLIIEVPVPELPERPQIQRVLGWDWGVRKLVTAVVLDLSGNRLSPPLFLDTGGFDGRQAHTRRHIDRLKSKVAKLEARRDRFPVGDQRREPAERKPSSLLANPSSRSSQKVGANPHVDAGCAGAPTRRSVGRCGDACATNATSWGCTWPGSTPGARPTPAPAAASLPIRTPRPLSMPKCSMLVPGCVVLPVAGMAPGTMPPRSISRS